MQDVEIVITIRAGKVPKVSVSTERPHAGTRKKHPSDYNAKFTANEKLTIEIHADLTVEIHNVDAASPVEERVEPPAETDAESAMQWHRYEDLFPESFESDYDENSQFAQYSQAAVGSRSPRR